MQRGSGRFRRAGAALLAGLTVTVGLAATAGTGSAAPGFTFTRLAGDNRYETARVVAESRFSTADTVILATGEAFPDALSGNYLAGNLGAPILLTTPAALHPAARTAMSNLRARNVIILGGLTAVSAAVEAELRTITSTAVGGGLLNVSRIGGANRYETSRLIASAAGTVPGFVGARRTAFVATGENFADALAAGPASYAAKLPVILTEGAALNSNARQALDDLNIQTAIILGGPVAVSAATETSVQGANQNPPPTTPTTTQRLQGADRTETARAIANFSVATLGFTATHVNLARGDEFPDALVGGPHAGREVAPILLTVSPTVLSNSPSTGAAAYISANAPTLTGGDIFGGPVAISAAVQAEATTLAQGSVTGPVTLNATSAQAGANITGTVTEPGNIVSLSVSGCGLSNQNLPVNATTGAFTVPIPAAQVAGNCTLTFVVQRTTGVSTTQAIAVTVTAATAARTNAPDLVSASASGNTVTYVFDEPPTGALLGNTFHIYNAAGLRRNPTNVGIIGNTVVATFMPAAVPFPTSQATTATVEPAAVTDAGGLANPLMAVPLTGFTQAGGITTAPDLLSVGNITTNALGQRTVDFVFDQAVAPSVFTPGVTPATLGASGLSGFELVLTDGTVIFSAISAVIATADGRTVTVTYGGLPPIPVSQIARATIDENTVSSTAGVPNVLQSADVQTGGITLRPDLLTADITGTNQVTFTFDEPVDPATLIAGNFYIYDANAAIQAAASVLRSATDARQVIATFPAVGTPGVTVFVSTAVGAIVETGAATGTTGFPTVTSGEDEAPLTGIVLAAGRTALPDLVSVNIANNAFNNAVVVYTFDQPLPAGYAAPAVDFLLYDVNATPFNPGGAGVVSGATVTFTTGTGNGFSQAAANAAVLGSVKDQASGNVGGVTPLFPEGSSAITR
jgi:putative cell wall-binding protein